MKKRERMLCPLPRTAVVSCAGPEPSRRRGGSLATRQGWGRFTSEEVLCNSRCFSPGTAKCFSSFLWLLRDGSHRGDGGSRSLSVPFQRRKPSCPGGHVFVKPVTLDGRLRDACRQICFLLWPGLKPCECRERATEPEARCWAVRLGQIPAGVAP